MAAGRDDNDVVFMMTEAARRNDGSEMGGAEENGNDKYRGDTYVREHRSRWAFGHVAVVHVGVPQDR